MPQPFDTTRTVVPRRGTPYVSQFLNFTRGVNNSISDENIAPDQLSDARNLIPDTLNAGVLINRPGIFPPYILTAQSAAITSFYQGRHGNYFTGTNTIKLISSDTNLDATLSHTATPDWTSYAGVDLYVNGTDAPRSIATGPVVSTLAGGPPTFKYIQEYNQHVYGAGHEDGRLRWADRGTTTTWPAINELIITDDSNDDITGLAKFGDALMVFCEKSFHRVRHGPSSEQDIIVAFSNFAEGCTSHRSIVVCPYGLFWWSKSGLCWSKDGFSFDLPFLRNIPQTLEHLNKGQYGRVHGTYDVRRGCVIYFFCQSGSSTEDFSVWYYPPDERFNRPESTWLCDGEGTRMGASGSMVLDYEPQVFVGSAYQNGWIFTHQTTSTSDPLPSQPNFGQPISIRLDTKREVTDYGLRAVKQSEFLTPMVIAVGSGALTYSVIVDNDLSADRSWTLFTTTSIIYFGESAIMGPNLVFQTGEHYQEYTLGYARKFHKIKHRIASAQAGGAKIRGIINSGTLVST